VTANIGPKRLDQFSLAHHPVASLDQVGQDRESLGPEFDLLVTATERAGIQIQPELAETESWSRAITADRIRIAHQGSPQVGSRRLADDRTASSALSSIYHGGITTFIGPER
jgi:hypothetical protein